MATVTTVPASRAQIFRDGLQDARGTITYWRDKWGTVTLDGPVPVEYFVSIEKFPDEDQPGVVDGCRIVFDAEAGQADMRSIDVPAGTRRRKPKVSSARLMNFNR
jgi:hypothetical protein